MRRSKGKGVMLEAKVLHFVVLFQQSFREQQERKYSNLLLCCPIGRNETLVL